MIKKFTALIVISTGLGLAGRVAGLNFHQALAISIFSVSILGTLFFWNFRLTFALLGISILLITQTIDIGHIVEYSSLEVILFLVGMMVLIGLLKDAGFFAWLVSLMLRIKNLTANKFIILISVISALSACAVDEVTSIIFIVAAVFEICDFFEVDPTPFIMTSVLATNIGSSGSALGNPIGILIAAKSGLTFEDFMAKAFPLMLFALGILIFIVMRWYRRPLYKLDRKIKELGSNEMLMRLISTPPERNLKICLGIFGFTLLAIALHHRFEVMLGLEPNVLLFAMPLISSGLVMAWKWKRAREFVEKDVEWYTLLFFLLIFAQAGTLKYTGATDVLAANLVELTRNNTTLLISAVLWIATIGSSVLDNVILVAAFIPIVQSFANLGMSIKPLWWALLFGGCFGGNITLVGSTANIVALGILEKERQIHLNFFRWFWIGLTVGVVTTVVVWMALLFIPMYR